MNKYVKIFSLLAAVVILLGGCGTTAGRTDESDNTAKNGNEAGNNDVQSGNDTGIAVFQAEVIEAGDGLFIAPDVNSNEYKSSDKISVNISECTITGIDGEEITGKELNAGDILSITYDGLIMESYPAQISASAVQVTDHNILIDAYLKMIDGIWQLDKGLNDGAEVIGVDTTGWVELTDIEKEIILTKLEDTYGRKITEGTSDELAEQGLIDKEDLSFPKGILITISNMSYDKDNKKISYSIQKWRSGDGAIGSDSSTASYNGTDWEIISEKSWIS